MKKNNNKEKGITLIALSVTIIVLIIIASVGTYSGLEALRDAKDQVKVSELNMLREPVLECYTKYNMTKLETYLKGEIVSYTEMQEIISEINSASNTTITLKQADYGEITDTTVKSVEYYYRLYTDDLEEMGVTQVDDTYIVNYKTGEIINTTTKVTQSGDPLYLSVSSN